MLPSRSPFRPTLLIATVLALFLAGGGCARQTRPPSEDEAEARRLYDRANLSVRDITEGRYSYDYINFHYVQAMQNIDRILTAYPDTEYARKIRDGELKLGPYAIDYYRNVLLAQLGDMKEATESVVNCAIYLYNLPEADHLESKVALGQILETLCRLVRTDEAMIFPVLPSQQLFAQQTIVEVLARGGQSDAAMSIVEGADPGQQPDLAASYGQGIAVGGAKLTALDDLVANYPAPDHRVELGILRGMIEREGLGYRDKYDFVKQEREKKALEDLRKSGKTPEKPKEAPVRYDIAAYYRGHFGSNPPPVATAAYAGYLALQGKLDEARALVANLGEPALVEVVANYYDHLGLLNQLTGRETLDRQLGLTADGVARCQLKLVAFLAQNDDDSTADTLEQAGMTDFPKFRDQFIRSRAWGQFYSRRQLFYLNEHTIPDLGIKDPAVCAEVLLDWFLSPNRLLKGSSWGADQIIFKYFSMQREGRPASRKLLKIK